MKLLTVKPSTVEPWTVKPLQLIICCFLFIAFNGCALVTVRHISGDPTQVQARSTYTIDAASVRDALDQEAPFHSLVVSTINTELTDRGFSRTERERADLLVSYYFSIATRTTDGVAAFHMRHSNDIQLRDITSSPAGNSARDPYEYDKGYLVIEFRDRESKLLWSGEAKGQVNEYNRENVRIKRVRAAVREIIALLDT